jgi:hypothetical protein
MWANGSGGRAPDVVLDGYYSTEQEIRSPAAWRLHVVVTGITKRALSSARTALPGYLTAGMG